MADRTSGAGFPPTRWSVVFSARSADDPAAAGRALSELCQAYWFPLYAFARRRGLSPPEAEDLTQDFFADFLGRNLLEKSDPAAGRLRTYLLTAFSRDLIDARRSGQRLKRGGRVDLVSLDQGLAEEFLRDEPGLQVSPESGYDRDWALALLRMTVEQVAREYTLARQQAVFEVLRPALDLGSHPDFDYPAAALQLKSTNAAVRQQVHRLRKRFRDLLRAHVADTLATPTVEAVEAELDALCAALR